MKKITEYKNGNLITTLYDDGTRVRYTDDDEFHPEFAESVDVHISSRCDNECKICYAGCSLTGAHAELMKWKFLDDIHQGTEMAININFPLNPWLDDFLKKMKKEGVIVNATINQLHFEFYERLIKQLIDEELIHGLGISITRATHEFVEKVKKYPNVVLHVINGVFNDKDYQVLKDNDLKVLILGFKDVGRGIKFHIDNQDDVESKKQWLYDELQDMVNHFKVLSFDNLALEQLDVKRLLTDEEWDEFYGGDDGEFSFFINLVDGYFAKNSLSDVHYEIGNKSIYEMFEIVKGGM